MIILCVHNIFFYSLYYCHQNNINKPTAYTSADRRRRSKSRKTASYSRRYHQQRRDDNPRDKRASHFGADNRRVVVFVNTNSTRRKKKQKERRRKGHGNRARSLHLLREFTYPPRTAMSARRPIAAPRWPLGMVGNRTAAFHWLSLSSSSPRPARAGVGHRSCPRCALYVGESTFRNPSSQ